MNKLILPFYPNVTNVLVFAIANPSVVCLSSVTFVRPTQGLKRSAIFLRRSVPFSHALTSVKNFTEIVLGEPLRRGC